MVLVTMRPRPSRQVRQTRSEDHWEKNVCVVFLRCAGEAGERLPLGKSEQFCAYLLFVGALAARLSDG